MTTKLLILVSVSLIFAACSSTAPTTSTNSNAPATTATPAPSASVAQATPTPDPNAPVKFVFDDFPATATTAKAGDYIMSPNQTEIVNMSQPNAKPRPIIYFTCRMIKPGETESEVQSLYSGSATNKVPNAYLIHIPPGQTAKVGDVVLTWWQSGSGMQTAIVTDASNPAEPTVRYLATIIDPNKDKIEKLKPNSFVKLTRPFQPGTSVAAKGDSSGSEHWDVISIAGDKVFAIGFAGRLKLLNRADCTPVPIKPQVKAGDKVSAVIHGSFTNATVVSVDEKLGKVVVKQDGQTAEKAIDFGKVMKP